jgi:hypothetical protein
MTHATRGKKRIIYHDILFGQNNIYVSAINPTRICTNLVWISNLRDYMFSATFNLTCFYLSVIILMIKLRTSMSLFNYKMKCLIAQLIFLIQISGLEREIATLEAEVSNNHLSVSS